MTHWSKTRWYSFLIHVTFVTVPFLASSVSAFLLWRDLFGAWYYAVPMVLTLDVLALTGLVLSIAHIRSPFVPLRHTLPFVSVVPLARELYLLLERNGATIAVSVTAIVIALFTWIAWQCFRTIEQLFISPVEAARERVRERLEEVAVIVAQLGEARDIAGEFAAVWQRPRMTAAAPRPDDSVTAAMTLPDSESKTARVKALADACGVSLSTAWRKVRSGEWQV